MAAEATVNEAATLLSFFISVQMAKAPRRSKIELIIDDLIIS
jgi:hypothetical protein